MIDGEYDLPEDSALGTLVALAVLFGGPFVLHLKFNVALGWSLLLPWVTLILVGLLVGLARKTVSR